MNPGCATRPQKNLLFGQALSDVCEKNGTPPKPIMVCFKYTRQNSMKSEFVCLKYMPINSFSCNAIVHQEILLVLCRKGPHTEGVFRKAGNAKALKEIKEQLNNGVEVDLKNKHVILLADLLKVTPELNCIFQYGMML